MIAHVLFDEAVAIVAADDGVGKSDPAAIEALGTSAQHYRLSSLRYDLSKLAA